MKLRITVEGKVYDVDVAIVQEATGSAPAPVAAASAPIAAAPIPASIPVAAPAPMAVGEKVFPSPLAGIVRQIRVAVGDTVAVNQEMIVLEAMKMETSVSAAAAGKIKAILVKVGENVQAGHGLIEFE